VKATVVAPNTPTVFDAINSYVFAIMPPQFRKE